MFKIQNFPRFLIATGFFRCIPYARSTPAEGELKYSKHVNIVSHSSNEISDFELEMTREHVGFVYQKERCIYFSKKEIQFA